jgi:hypothetical protein
VSHAAPGPLSGRWSAKALTPPRAKPRPMFDVGATGASGDGFNWQVRRHDLFIGLKQLRPGARQASGRGDTASGGLTSELACEVCGRLPHPRKLRLAMAKLAAVFPIELLLHALVIYFHMSYVLTVTLLAISTTVLVIWVVEPSAMRLLTRWLHAPALHARKRLHGAESLWRVRATLDDRPGSLAAITHGLAAVRATILERQAHPLGDVQDEIVVGAGKHVPEEDLRDAIRRGGGVDVDVWQTTALALVDGQTKALTLAARVAVTPEELPLAIADLLDAQVVTDPQRIERCSALGADDRCTLQVPSPATGLFVFSRPDKPFTVAESCRANRLAQIAETALITQAASATPPKCRTRKAK